MKSKDFSPDMLIAYLGLRLIITKGKNEYYVSTGLLSYSLFGKQVVNQLITKSIINGIKELIKNKYIIHIDENKKTRSNEYILDVSRFQIDKIKSKNQEDFYSSIELCSVIKIMKLDIKEKFKILDFYCYLITTITKSGIKSGVGFTSYVNMATSTGMCRQTISKYMNILESNNIIYIYKSTDAVIKNGVVQEIPNTYGDVANKNKINKVGSEFEENYGENAKKIKSTKSSSTRSASAKYNIILSDLKTTGEIRYKYNVMKEIYETLAIYNKKYNHDENLQKDLSIFSNYDFYKE